MFHPSAGQFLECELVAPPATWVHQRAEALLRAFCLGEEASVAQHMSILNSGVPKYLTLASAEILDALKDLQVHARCLSGLLAERCALTHEPLREDAEQEEVEQLHLLIERLSELVEAASARDRAAVQRYWRQWAADACSENGGRAAHRFLKAKHAWTPSVVKLSSGIVTARPEAYLEVQRSLWKDVWQAIDCPGRCPHAALPSNLPARGNGGCQLPQLDPEALRVAAASFSASTATQLDGWALKSLRLLSSEALWVLVVMFTATDMHGMIPSQCSLVTMPMLPKPAGGHRLIGLFAAYARLWVRARLQPVQQWEHAFQAPWQAASAGRAPLDPVCRLEIAAEAGQAQGLVAATGFGAEVWFFNHRD